MSMWAEWTGDQGVTRRYLAKMMVSVTRCSQKVRIVDLVRPEADPESKRYRIYALEANVLDSWTDQRRGSTPAR
jgi:hypothetical protein